MPHVFELKRPSKSDPEDVMGLSMWWCNYTKLLKLGDPSMLRGDPWALLWDATAVLHK